MKCGVFGPVLGLFGLGDVKKLEREGAGEKGVPARKMLGILII